MPTALFMLLPFPSHLMPCFGLAREWEKKGYNVVFTGTIELKELIENEGFEFYEFQYATEYNILSFKGFMGLWLKTWLDKSFTRARYKEFYISQLAAVQVVEIYHPQKVYIDEHISEYYFFLKNMT